MTTILVTGATGTVGSKVVAALRAAGHEVRAGVRSPERAGALEALGARPVRLDLEDEASLRAAMAAADRVLLLTPFVEHSAPLVASAMAAARAAGVTFALRMSALGADPGSPFALARDHAAAEAAVTGAGLPWAVIRPTFFRDNLATYQAGPAAAMGQVFGAAGDGRSSYVSTQDVAEAAAAILADPSAHAGKVYTLTGPEALSDAEVAETYARAAGRPIAYVDLPPETLRGALLEQGTPAWRAQALLDL